MFELATLLKEAQSQAWAAVDLILVIFLRFFRAHASIRKVLICFMTSFSFLRSLRSLTMIGRFIVNYELLSIQ